MKLPSLVNVHAYKMFYTHNQIGYAKMSNYWQKDDWMFDICAEGLPIKK